MALTLAVIMLLFRHSTPIAGKEFAPIFFLELDFKFFSRLGNAFPGLVALFVRNTFHLIKPSNSFLHMPGIHKWLFALFRKSEITLRQFLAIFVCEFRHELFLLS